MHEPAHALRLPAAVGLVCTLWCVFVYARRRCSEALALLCTTAVWITCVFQYYAQEARPYSMVVALIAFAMVCYQRVERMSWRVLLGMSLFLAQSLHYLAVLAMVPFGAAELLETWKSKKIRTSVWAALAIGVLPLAIFWNLLQLNKTYYGQHDFYAKFPFSAIPSMYADFLGVSSYVGAAVGLTALAAILVSVTMPGRGGNCQEGDWNAATSGEAMLLFVLAGLLSRRLFLARQHIQE